MVSLFSRVWKHKMLFIMRLTFSICLFCVLQSFAIGTYSQSVRLSINQKNISIESALQLIEDKTEYYFMYSALAVDVKRTVDIEATNKLVPEILENIFKGTDTTFKIDGRLVALSNNGEISPVNQQQKSVSGRVTDSSGGSLPGVSVVVKGTTNGTITDVNGNYSLSNFPANATLQFSFVGMKTQEMVLGNKTVINVILEEETIGIDEVVAIGYGTQKKGEVTSAIVNIKKENFNKGAVTSSPMQMVQGKIAGLAIHQVNNDPNGNVAFQLRGVSTVSGNTAPLVIVDGVPGNINYVSPEDIESIDVLRDGSAAAIYGTRGTNGVIIVTTKKGQEGKAEVQYSGYVSYETLSNKPDLLTGDEYRQVSKDFLASGIAGKVARGSSMIDYGANTDWFKEITQNAVSQVHYLSVSGGSKNTTYMGSLDYRDNSGIIKRSSSNSLNAHLRVAHSGLNDRLKISFNLTGLSKNYSPTDYGIYSQTLKRNPTQPVYNADGTFYETYAWDDYNPVASIMQVDRNNEVTKIQGDTRISYQIVPGLTASVMGSLLKDGNFYGYYEKKNSATSINGGYQGNAARSYSQYVERTLETTLNYAKLFNDVHNINILGGYTYEDFRNESFSAGNSKFITDQYTYNNLGAGDYLTSGQASMSSSKYTSKLISFLGRAMYSYKNKYLLTTGFRYEGSSKFGANNKWGMFPNLSLGWRISEENFMKNISWIDDMKIRTGFGKTGNQGTNPYASLVRLGQGARMLYNGQWLSGTKPLSNPNPDLKWETKTEINIGVDLVMLKKRLSTQLDFYKRTTNDLIYTYDVPMPPNIFNTTTANVGTITNKGVELSVNAIPVQKNNFKWNIDFNISYNANKLVSLSNENYPFDFKDILYINSLGLSNVATYRLEEGRPIGDMLGYRFAGFTKEGKWMVYNKSGEEIPLTSAVSDDKGIIGNGLPKIYSGLTNTFRYKNFDLTVMLRGSFGFDIISLQALTHQNAYMLPLNVIHSSIESELFDTPSYNSYYVEKGDFVKVDNVTFGYNFNVGSSKVIKQARIYASGHNLYTFTGYTGGSDPELEINGLGPGFDNRSGYPHTRTFTFGVSVTF